MVLNVQLNVITKRHVASAPLAVPGITVTSRLGYASRLEPAKPHPRNVAQSRQPRLKTTTTLVVSLTSYALHQDINRSLDCASPQVTTAMASKYRNSTREATCVEHRVFDGHMGGSPL